MHTISQTHSLITTATRDTLSTRLYSMYTLYSYHQVVSCPQTAFLVVCVVRQMKMSPMHYEIGLWTRDQYQLHSYIHTCTYMHALIPLQVFLGIMTRSGRYSHKRLIRTLQLMMIVGIVWVVFSFGASVFRIPSLHLLDADTQIQWIPSYQPHTKRSMVILHYSGTSL